MSTTVPETRQSSIMVAVRLRPFTDYELAHLVREDMAGVNYQLGDSTLTLPGVENSTPTKLHINKHRPQGLRQIVDCVDDKMLIFDPADSNPLRRISETVLNSLAPPPNSGGIRSRSRRSGEQKFVFDKVFDVNSTQLDVYEATARPLLDAVLDGFHGTVFAYGATGCGKTFTVNGPPENPGIVFLTMQDLFARIEELQDTKRFELRASYLEIYNETIIDLLEPTTPPKKLVIREDANRHISVANLSHHVLHTIEDVMDLVVRGNSNRTTSPTDANETSSRSHAVLQIHITQKNRTAELTEDHKFATLSIIDLAGSERASATKNRGERLHEGANINRSLLALGNCINALCVNGRRQSGSHVPYRDSKLTRLLKFSLGGNCKTVMIVCISPSSSHYDETLNTLKYATRAKEIKTKIIRNQHSLDRHVGSYLKMISEQRQEIDELRRREGKIVELKLNTYKIAREKLHLALWDSVHALRNNYKTAEKFQHLKMMKSLMLCKRRFLQMVSVELNILLKHVDQRSDVYENCLALQEQLMLKVKDLERSFDTPDELDMALERSREVDLVKLQEMDGWIGTIDLPLYESLLYGVSESLRNEILVNSSIIMEKLLEDETLVNRYKFVSNTLLERITNASHQFSGETNEKEEIHDLSRELHAAIQDLVSIDEEFERFAASVRIENLSIAAAASFHPKKSISYRKPAKVVKSNSGSPSPVQRRAYKPAKKVRWSELQPGNETSMMMDEDDAYNDSLNVAAGRTEFFDEDISMQDEQGTQEKGETCQPAIALTAAGNGKLRKMSLTATALVRNKENKNSNGNNQFPPHDKVRT